MNIQKHYESVKVFNEVAGNLDNVTVASIEAQMKVVVEEVKELEKAFADKNGVELLDGACDAFVTVMGLLQQMEVAGFKVDEAIGRVNTNNLMKFPSEITLAEIVLYKERGWHSKYNSKYSCCVLKDKNGKIRKPIGFQPVELSDLVPEGFFGGCV